MPLAVSACLAGYECRYDGKYQGHPLFEEMVRCGQAIPVCPEVMGGLAIPRIPSERCGDKVVNAEGDDVTAAFYGGARASAEKAFRYGCDGAVLKARSPSCGCGRIYDGSFGRNLIDGDGVFAEILRRQGIALHTEEDFPVMKKI